MTTNVLLSEFIFNDRVVFLMTSFDENKTKISVMVGIVFILGAGVFLLLSASSTDSPQEDTTRPIDSAASPPKNRETPHIVNRPMVSLQPSQKCVLHLFFEAGEKELDRAKMTAFLDGADPADYHQFLAEAESFYYGHSRLERLDLLADGSSGIEVFLRELAIRWSKTDPKAAALQLTGSGLPGKMGDAVAQAVERWATAFPDDIMSTIASFKLGRNGLSGEQARETLSKHAAAFFLKSDPALWIEKHLMRASGEEKSLLVAASIANAPESARSTLGGWLLGQQGDNQVASQLGNYVYKLGEQHATSALIWAGEIQNPAARFEATRGLMDSLSSIRPNEFVSLVEDPAVMAQLTQRAQEGGWEGKHSFVDELLSQYVRSSFSEDLETARETVGQISSTELRERLLNEIREYSGE
jgi:hypothetical protein